MILIYSFFSFVLAFGCLWDSSIDPTFLDANPIRVCINAPDENISEEMTNSFNQASEHVKNSIRSLESRTVLNFQIDTEFCDQPNSGIPARVRIQLMPPPTTSGEAVTGEGFPYAQRNLLIPFLNEVGNSRGQSNLDFLTQHEMLHLLGIQHDDRGFRGGINVEKRRREQPEIIELSENFTAESIMNLSGSEPSALYRGDSFRENMQVTDHDIQCIRSVFRRRNEIRQQTGTELEQTIETTLE